MLMGGTADGKKALIAVNDGSLCFWAALREAYPTTREQRCWVHKTANVINSMPKAIQPTAKPDLHQIWLAESAARRWRGLNGSHQLTLVTQGRIVADGIPQNAA